MYRIVSEVLFWSGPAIVLLTVVIFCDQPFTVHPQQSLINGLILIGFGLFVIGTLMPIFQQPKKEVDKL